MSQYFKYQRTMHLPWSPGTTSDDKIMHDITPLFGKTIVITEKMDGENCLDEDTLINTENGIKSIKEICETLYFGNVLSYNHELEINEYKQIVGHNIKPTDDCDEWYEIELENGNKIKMTSEHYVFLPKLNCYRQVKDLTINDELHFY